MGRGGEAGVGTAGVACCGLIWVIVSCFLLGFSFDTLEPTTMALMYNENTCFLDPSTLYNANDGEGGRWFTGLGVHFLEFPRNLLRVKFNSEEDADGPLVSAKTFNGTSITMGFSAQYGLKRDAQALYDLYMRYGQDYQKFFAVYTRHVTRDVISTHPVVDLWEKRKEVGEEIQVALTADFEPRGAFVANVQTLSLDIPVDIQNAIETTTVAYQKIAQAEFDKQAETVVAQTKRLVAEKTAEILVLNARGQAEALILDTTAQAQALNITIGLESEAYATVKDTFSFNNDELLNYIWLDNIKASSAAKTYISVNQPTDTVIA